MSTTVARLPRSRSLRSPADSRHDRIRRILLAGGVLYSVSYVLVNDVLAAAWYDGYSRLTQTVSELSAKGATPQGMLRVVSPIWTLLMLALGIGVWRSAEGRRSLRTTGGLLIAGSAIGPLWLIAPMTPRDQIVPGAAMAGEDILHLVLSGATMATVVAGMVFASRAFGKRYRLYTYVSIVVFLVFSVLTAIGGARLAAGDPTPWLGLYERAMLAPWLVWMTVLAAVLWRRSEPVDAAVGEPSRAIHAGDGSG